MTRKRFEFLSLWAINDRLELQALKEQLDELRLSGLDGVIFHPRNYPNEPEYMSPAYLKIITELIIYAKSTGMKFWIYDENGWPSGTANGQVLRENPEYKCEWIEINRSEGSQDGIILTSFEENPGKTSHIELHARTNVSSLDSEATGHFIRLIHEAYRKGLSPEAFEYVTGFFSDEVAFLDGHSVAHQYGGIPWKPSFPEEYEARYGESLLPLLPLLFVDGEQAAEVRTNYWEMLTDALITGFYAPVQAWCEQHDKLFTAHLKAEENPFFQLSYSGSAFQILPHVALPAIDALERNPGNHFYPRMAHSISVQQGRESTLVEAMGGAGWGASPESFKTYALWLASHGIEIFVMHLAQFKLSMQAMHDWPPSIPLHLNWKKAFSAILEDIKDEATKLPDLRNNQPELLVITPTRGIMGSFLPHEAMVMNEHDGSVVPDTASGLISKRFMDLVQELHEAGLHYEFTEEKVVEEQAVIDSGVLHIGQRSYSRILMAEGCLWHPDADGIYIIDTLTGANIEILTPVNWRAVLGEKMLTDGRDSGHGTGPQHESALAAQSPWTITAPADNQLLVELHPDGKNQLTGKFHVATSARPVPLNIHFIDPMTSVAINGHLLHGIQGKDSLLYDIPAQYLAADEEQLLTVVTRGQSEPNAIAFLRGRFLVKSLAAYKEKDLRQWSTLGPFIAEAAGSESIQGDNLIEAGFPFCKEAAAAKKIITIYENKGEITLKLTGIHADVAQVFLDGKELGWTWGPDWNFELPQELAGGDHDLMVSLVPSTFNAYGPHRYFEGDRHLTSPFQYAGIKSFADSPDAPEETLGNLWHFVKWGIEGDVVQATGLQESGTGGGRLTKLD